MKNGIMKSGIVAIAALCLAYGCQRAEMDAPAETETVSVSFTTAPIEAKTTFGEISGNKYPTYWTDNDSKVAVSLNLSKPLEIDVTPSADYLNARFSGDFPVDGSAPYTFYLLSPSSVAESASASRNCWNILIPAIQTPSENSVDESSQVLVAKTDPMDAIPSQVEVYFSHLTAYAKVALKNVDKALETADFENPSIVSVDFTSEEAFAGSWYYNVDDGSVTPKDPSYTVTLKVSDIADASLIENLWFSCLPADMSEKYLKIRVNTDKGSVERTITFPSGLSFKSGKVATFSVDMETAVIATTTIETPEVVFSLVKDLNDLEEGDDFILVNTYNNPMRALSTSAATTSGLPSVMSSKTSFSFDSDGYIRLAKGTNVDVMYVYSKNGSALSFVGYNGGLYLNGTRLGWTESASSITSWTVSIADNGAATIYATSSNKKYYIRYYSSYFSVNTTSTNTVAIYKKIILYKSSTTADQLCDENDPVLGYEEYGAYLNDSNRQIYTRQTDQLSREYGYSTVSFGILTPSSGKILEFSGIPNGATKDRTFTLTVCRYHGTDVAYIKRFNVIVVKEEGAKLWLSTGAGEGFIVKK